MYFHSSKLKRAAVGCDIDSNQLTQLIANLILDDKDSIETLTLGNFKDHPLTQELASSIKTFITDNSEESYLINTKFIGGSTVESYRGIIDSLLKIDKIITSCNSTINFNIISADSIDKGCPNSFIVDYNGQITPIAEGVIE